MYSLHEYNALTKFHKFEEDDHGGGTPHSHQAENDIQDMHLTEKTIQKYIPCKKCGYIWKYMDHKGHLDK